MEGRGQALGTPGNAPALPAPRALPDDGKKAVVGTDEAASVGVHYDGVTHSADAGVNHGEDNGIRRVFEGQGGEEMRGSFDGKIRRVVKRVDDGDARGACGEDRLDLAYVKISGTEIGEQNDQAALASFFLAGFFSSAPAAAVSSARSIRLTSASGALSPLRKPVLRMRR